MTTARTAPHATAAWTATTILFVTWLMAFIDRFVILLVVPGMKLSLGVSDTQVSLLLGPAFSLVFAVGGLLLSRLVDTTNRRNLILTGLIGWSIAEVACGLARSFEALFAARLFMGLCQAVLAPASFSLVADLFPVERRGKPIAILTSGAAIGAALANFAGGVLLQTFLHRPPLVVPFFGALEPWQSTMAITGLPGLLIALLYFFLSEPPRTVLTTAEKAEPAFRLMGYMRRNLALFVLLLSAFGFQFMVAYGIASWFAVLLMRNGGFNPAQAGLAMGGMTLLTGISAGLLGGWLSDRVARVDRAGGRIKLAIVCLILEALSFLPLLSPYNVVALIACYIPYAVLGTVVAALSYTILPDLVPGAGRGRILAFHQLIASEVGLGLGPTLIAVLTDHVFRNDHYLNYSMMAVAMPCAAMAALLLALALPRARKLREAMDREAERAAATTMAA